MVWEGEQGQAQMPAVFILPTGQEKGTPVAPVMCFSVLAISENYEGILAWCGGG